MTVLHPRGVNHLALSTVDMKGQLTFWCDVLGCPLKALYWMHGVKGALHGFVELSPTSYVAFVQHPRNASEVVKGVTHSLGSAGPVTAGTMQHVALHVDSFEELLSIRDRIRSRGRHVLGPIDHGFIQSVYFSGPENLSLEIACGANIAAEHWVDPEVVELCGITNDELEGLKAPAPYHHSEVLLANPAVPVADDLDPTDSGSQPNPGLGRWEQANAALLAMDDQEVWDRFSEPTPPVV